jgi:hypothetical protein
MSENVKFSVKSYQKEVTDSMDQTGGVRQRCGPGPFLINIFINGVIKEVSSGSVHAPILWDIHRQSGGLILHNKCITKNY